MMYSDIRHEKLPGSESTSSSHLAAVEILFQPGMVTWTVEPENG
jgi:hypothetical protein